jgi:hypothetical protein
MPHSDKIGLIITALLAQRQHLGCEIAQVVGIHATARRLDKSIRIGSSRCPVFCLSAGLACSVACTLRFDLINVTVKIRAEGARGR